MARHLPFLTSAAALLVGSLVTVGADASPSHVQVCNRTVARTATAVSCWGSKQKVLSLAPLAQLPNLRKLTVRGPVSGMTPEIASRLEEVVVHLPAGVNTWRAPQLIAVEKVVIHGSGLSSSVDVSALSTSPRLHTVVVTRAVVSGLSRLPSLRALELRSAELREADAINGLSGLTSLELQRVGNVAVIGQLPKLARLSVKDCAPEITANVGALTSLNTLAISGVERVPSLHKLTNLESLELSWNRNLVAVPGLARLSNLRKLELRKTGVTDIRPIASLRNLEKLDIANTKVKTLRPLAKLTKLTTLNATALELRDLRPLRNLLALEELSLGNALRGRVDLSPLARLRKLENLEIMGAKPRSWRPLATLTNLKTLHVSSSSFRDTRTLARMRKLENLYMNATKVRSLRGLARLNKLNTLAIDDTEVRNLTPLAKLEKLQHVSADTPILRKKHGSCASFKLGNAWVTVEECGGC